MSIQIGGLASGLDTNGLIRQLLQLERRPIERLQREKAFLTNRTKAFTDFDAKLKDLLSKAEGLDKASKIVVNKATATSEDYFKLSASSAAVAGSYNIEVVSLAQREKEVSQGFADVNAKEFGTGTITLKVGSETVELEVTTENNSLGGIRNAINAAGAGVKASIINDGDPDNPYRLVVTADESGTSVEISADLSEGSYALPVFEETMEGTKAHIRVDGIDIFRNTNSITGAIPGVTIDLVRPHENVGMTTSVQVELDVDGVDKKLRDFVASYNEIVRFVSNQKDASWGRDAGLQMPRRNLQALFSTQVGVAGNFQALSELGLSTQKDGTIKIDGTKLKNAIRDDVSSITALFAGSQGVEGIAAKFKDYLKASTDRHDGILAGRKKTVESTQRRLDAQIERQEARLEQREKTLRAQFTAMEDLVSVMGAQSNYLAQQMGMLSNLWSRK